MPCQVRPWTAIQEAPVHLLCDARSTPPRIAAVCVEGKDATFADVAPEPATLAQFQLRGDKQIASLEMLAVAFGTMLHSSRRPCA